MRALIRALATAALALGCAGAPAFAQSLDPVLQRLAAAWQKGDAAAVTALAARGGISLDIEDGAVGPLGSRQAAAVLRRLFDERESVSARPNNTRPMGGQPERGFGEIIWTTRARGTTIPERATFFVAFVREGDGWRITEIRRVR